MSSSTSSFVDASAAEAIPPAGPVIVSLQQWQAHRADLLARGTPLGIRLHSDQSPELIAADVPHFALVALEFPKFRDGRAYSYARLLRERYGFKGELRAVGEVLLEQLFFMLRTGFDAFELAERRPARRLSHGARGFLGVVSADGGRPADGDAATPHEALTALIRLAEQLAQARDERFHRIAFRGARVHADARCRQLVCHDGADGGDARLVEPGT